MKILTVPNFNVFFGDFQGFSWIEIQARIAQLSAYWLGTSKVPGSNPGKGENYLVNISNWIVRI